MANVEEQLALLKLEIDRLVGHLETRPYESPYRRETHGGELVGQSVPEVLSRWDNRMLGHVLSIVLLVILASVYVALTRVAEPKTVAFYMKTAMFCSATLTGIILLWGRAADDLPVNPWFRLRVKGKLLVIFGLITLMCTAKSIAVDQLTRQDESIALEKRLEGTSAKLEKLDKEIVKTQERLQEGVAPTILGGIQDHDTRSSSEAEKLHLALRALSDDHQKVRKKVAAIGSVTESIPELRIAIESGRALNKAESDELKWKLDEVMSTVRLLGEVSQETKQIVSVLEVLHAQVEELKRAIGHHQAALGGVASKLASIERLVSPPAPPPPPPPPPPVPSAAPSATKAPETEQRPGQK